MRTNYLTILGTVLLAGSFAQFAEAQGAGSIGTSNNMPGMVPQNNVQATSGQPTQSAAPPIPGTVNDGPARPVAYQNAERGFMLVAPPGARFQESADKKQLSIQSRKGYAVNIQAGDANPAMDTTAMFRKLEVQYLGEGKPWARKTAEGKTVIAGLPAGVGFYEAGQTKTKVVIARGKNTDFVFMFFAPFTHFEKLTTEFEWILASFRPDPEDVPSSEETMASIAEPKQPPPPLRAAGEPEVAPAGRPEIAKLPSASDVLVFSEAGYGYRVEYPSAWLLEKTSAFTNTISGPQGTPAYDAIVALQNVKPQGEGADAAQAAFDDLKSSLSRQAHGVEFVGEKAVTYAKYGMTLEGRQFVANYDHQGQRFRKWALVIPRPEGGIAHIWSYTAPARQFDAYRPIAERILNSLKIEGGRG
ncbi:MAG: hypothetical protein WD075_08890 [Rhodospirillales bacterium]